MASDFRNLLKAHTRAFDSIIKSMRVLAGGSRAPVFTRAGFQQDQLLVPAHCKWVRNNIQRQKGTAHQTEGMMEARRICPGTPQTHARPAWPHHHILSFLEATFSMLVEKHRFSPRLLKRQLPRQRAEL